MKILKLLFAVAILSFIVVDFSVLYAADEPSATASTVPALDANDLVDSDVVVDEQPQRKSFARRLMFWKRDANPAVQPTDANANPDEVAITDEDIDPRLAKERSKPKEIRIRDKYGIKVDTLKFFEANLKVKDETLINRDTEFVVPLDEIDREIYIEEFYDRRAPIVMSRLDLKQTVDSYKEEYFPNFKEIGRIKVIFSDVPINEIKGYGAFIGANFIIMKKFFEPTIGKFVYDILFLTGDTDNRSLYWFRSSDEAEPLAKTLGALNVTNLNDYMNIVTHNMLNPNRRITKKIDENYQAEKTREAEEIASKAEGQDSNNPAQRQTVEALALRAREAQNSLPDSDVSNFSMFLLNDMSEEELFELQQRLITFRVNAVVGLWEDVISGDVIEIRALPKVSNEQKEVVYAAYAVLGSDLDSVVRYTTDSKDTASSGAIVDTNENGDVLPNANADNQQQVAVDGSLQDIPLAQAGDEPTVDETENPVLNGFSEMSINKGLSWLTRDLKMQFSATSGSGFFVDNEKMVNEAVVYFHPAKGLIVVALPNREFRYYRPIVPDVYPVLEEALYNERNIKETNVDQDRIARFSQELDSTPGTTNYFLFSGVTLGVVVTALLILM
ncbi:MAG: hypothetical protein LBH40_04265 [Alphaproteobacteria bacterium]|jgi:hypothetical protein|nr:hypothetical protein [Alphaproteobacteria bacterium]